MKTVIFDDHTPTSSYNYCNGFYTLTGRMVRVFFFFLIIKPFPQVGDFFFLPQGITRITVQFYSHLPSHSGKFNELYLMTTHNTQANKRTDFKRVLGWTTKLTK